MPGPTTTDAQLRQWYDNFARELKEKVSIDVTLKADIGRVKNFPILRWNAEDWNTPQVGEPTYAYVPHGENGYTVPAPQDPTADEHTQWLKDNLNPEVDIEQIRELYNMSRAGTLMVTAPGKDSKHIQQVYTNEDGVITTSLPAAWYRENPQAELPENQRMPELPRKVSEPDPANFDLPAKPQAPVPPENRNPGFLSWLGYILGFNTDYAKLVQYQRDVESLSDRVEAWRNSLNEYNQTDVNNYWDAVASRNEYELALEVYQREPLAILRGINTGYQRNFDDRVRADAQNGVEQNKQYSFLARREINTMAQLHSETFAGKMEKALETVNGLLYLSERTDKALDLLAGPKAEPGKMTEWLELGAYKKDEFKFKQYDLPEYVGDIISSEEENQARKAAWDKENTELATLAAFAALNDPTVTGKTLKPGCTAEETSELLYTNILYNLFTTGRIRVQSEMAFMEPAREKGMEAFNAYRRNNDPSQLGRLLGNCLRQLNRETATEADLNKEGFLNKLYLIKRVRQVLNKEELMAHAGLNERELKETDANIALYEVMHAGMQAKKRIVEHAMGTNVLSNEELVKAGQDILFAQLISDKVEAVYQQVTDEMDKDPERMAARESMSNTFKVMNLQKAMEKARANNDADLPQKEAEWQAEKKKMDDANRLINLQDLRRPVNQTCVELLNTASVTEAKAQLIDFYDLNKITTMDMESLAKIASSRFEFEKVFVAKDKQGIGSLMQQKSLQKEQVQADQGAVALAEPNVNAMM